MADRVRAAEVARRLGVNRSTVSRWLQKHPALQDEHGMIDVEEFRAHHAATVNTGNQTKAPAARAVPDAPGSAQSEQRDVPKLNDHRARTENAKATLAELDLADRLNRTLDRDQVTAAAGEVGQTLRQRAAELVRDRAERLAHIEDTREMEHALAKMMEDLLTSAAQALRKIANPDSDSADAA